MANMSEKIREAKLRWLGSVELRRGGSSENIEDGMYEHQS